VGEYVEITLIFVISLVAFVRTEFTEMFSGRQPLQDVAVSDVLWTD